jgi:oligogalacturonide lyase
MKNPSQRFAPAGVVLLASFAAGCIPFHGITQEFDTNNPTLRNEWVDSDTGHRVVRWSRVPGSSESLYFHQNAFTPKGDKMVFENSAPGATNRLFVLDVATLKAEPQAQ